MTCCTYKCNQGRDCPVRKKEAINKYTDYGNVYDLNPAEEVFGTFKALVIVLAVCIAVTLLFFVWGKT
jgi:hypothetical protein